MSGGQLSLFSAELQPPAPTDLAGLLAGPAQLVRRGRAARVSVVVTEGWRARALVAALDDLGLHAESLPGERTGSTVVRTALTDDLAGLADEWAMGAVKRPPARLILDGARLRWWSLAAGRPGRAGYLLGLGPGDEPVWPAVGAALASLGLPAALVGPRADGPAYRVVGRKRLARLRELVGGPPAGVRPEAWPPERS
jgi:hypothetical protein